MILTDIVLKNLATAGRYTDDQTKGLHLWIKPSYQRYWIFRYTADGVRQNMSLGAYPMIGLKEARQRATKARHDINNGINPINQKKVTKAQIEATQDKLLFNEFALNYIAIMKPKWSNPKHADQWVSTMKTYAFPIIGEMSLDQIDTPHIKEILLPIWNIKPETASRVRGRLERILSAAIVDKLRQPMNPALWKGHLEHLLPPPPKSDQHHAALPYEQMTVFMAALKEVDGVGALALQFTILNASRTGEVIHAMRSEINGDVWTIPAKRMKTKKEHQVPLCKRSLELIAMAAYLEPNSQYLFSRQGKPLSSMAMLMQVRRQAAGKTVHGFRSSFRDWVSEETDHSPEVAEMALAHTIGNKSEAAYRRRNLLERRRKLMTDWESYCLTGTWGNIVAFPVQKTA